jgi:hypothetical protein
VGRDVFERDLTKCLALPIKPDQKLTYVEPVMSNRVQSQIPFADTKLQKATHLCRKKLLHSRFMQSSKQAKPVRRMKHECSLPHVKTLRRAVNGCGPHLCGGFNLNLSNGRLPKW